MEREIRVTGDGSHTLYVNSLDEPYHSIHGALQESKHVFIEQGLRQVSFSPVRILEIGFGTGLNLLLTLEYSLEKGIEVYYHTVEKYPLSPVEYLKLNYTGYLHTASPDQFEKIHQAPWDISFEIGNHFRIYKEHADFRNMEPKGTFDLVYFDAFAPDKQPELWDAPIFRKVYELMVPGGILVTYTAKGSVRRTLGSCGFEVSKVPGPPGKREMIRAKRI